MLLIALLVATIAACVSGDAPVSHPWIFDCAKNGVIDSELPPSGSGLENLLACMVDQSMSDRYTEDDLNIRDTEVEWCLPSDFLDRSCLSSGFEPHEYLVHCLFDNPTFGSFYFENETGNAEPFVDDSVIVEEALKTALCDLINGLRSPQGVSCLVDVCQTVSSSPSSVPSSAPSFHPTERPSFSPSATSSDAPSAQYSDQPTSQSTEILQGDEVSLRYPPLVVRIEILLRFNLQGTTRDVATSDKFLDVLAIGTNNILKAKVEGHESAEILLVDAIHESDELSVLLRAKAAAECSECSASELAEQIVNQYLSALKSASKSGSLANQIEFHGFVSDLPPLSNVTIDPASVESLAGAEKLRAEAKVSGSVATFRATQFSFLGILLVVVAVV
ncbi:MAG: hypothetical protein SGARI_002099 [Bacillariaceae sp.]